MARIVHRLGSRREVFNGTAKRTSGGLEKKHLLKNKYGRIVSRKKHATAKREKRLVKYGYGAKKGKFGYVKVKPTKKVVKRRKRKTQRRRR
tara:strand:+ start:644 stop:916 length:273 start_codon:yes stop_codon:yes gene_type:complete